MNKFVNLLIYVAIFIVGWNLLDYIFTTFIEGEAFVFSVNDAITQPIILAVIIFFVEQVLPKKNKKKNKKKKTLDNSED